MRPWWIGWCLASACAAGGSTPDAGPLDAGSALEAGTPRDAEPDAAAPIEPDAALDASAALDATPPDAGAGLDATPLDGTPLDAGASGRPCSFHRECPAPERCACAAGDCRCEVGPRGTGQAGVDACAAGEECASGVCLEGPGGGFLCSAECRDGADCPATLPRCVTIPTVGAVCARDPNARPDAGQDPSCPTALVARFGAVERRFDRAQHGLAGTDELYVEAHFGGDLACPTESSPTPARTLVLAGLGRSGAAETEADGLTATLLDFDGDLIATPLLRASAVSAIPRSLEPGVALCYEVSIAFPGGIVTGTLWAPHCPSLDD